MRTDTQGGCTPASGFSSTGRPCVLFLVAVLAWLAAVPTPAATIVVTTEEPAENPGDGYCSLVEAVNNANADTDSSLGDCPPGAGDVDTIELGPGAVYTLVALRPLSPEPDHH